MIFDIPNLKKIRKHVGMTQKEFAKEAGISQSMVAKIESGKLDPTYSYVKKIERAVNSMNKKHEKSAKEVMNSKIISIKKQTSVKEIVKILTENNISQLPIIEKGNIIGLVTESDILGVSHKEIAANVMKDAPPIISDEAGIDVIISLLKFYPIVLVKKHSNLVGLITKTDIITKIN